MKALIECDGCHNHRSQGEFYCLDCRDKVTKGVKELKKTIEELGAKILELEKK